MPSMSILLEGLVTTLLSLDYLHQQPEAPLTYKPQSVNANLQAVPFSCRSNSLSSSSDSESSTTTTRSNEYQYHCPPDGMTNYDTNDTVFGAILRGDLPAVTLAESSRLLALEDIKPRAPLHALIIPKAFVGSVFDLDASDLEWTQEVQELALELVQTHHPEAYANNDYRLCFHVPPFHSVDHLHLHVLAPVSKMGFFYNHIKYNPRTRWCSSLESVVERLERGESAVPYRRPGSCVPQKETAGLFLQQSSVVIESGVEDNESSSPTSDVASPEPSSS